MFYLTTTAEDILAYEESEIKKYVSWSVTEICIQWDIAGSTNDRLFMSEALERKGEDPLKCRDSSQ